MGLSPAKQDCVNNRVAKRLKHHNRHPKLSRDEKRQINKLRKLRHHR